jgi:hypothetical protein
LKKLISIVCHLLLENKGRNRAFSLKESMNYRKNKERKRALALKEGLNSRKREHSLKGGLNSIKKP